MLKEIHTAPLISHWIWYRVGSRDETPGLTGASHWVEHMLFKGTPRYPQGVLDKAISRQGGYWNAFTHLDWTTFFETLPADKIDLFAATVNQYSGVTHNYLRENQYNVWFTFIAPSMQEIEDRLADIARKTGINDILNLPATHVFKIKAQFKV